MSSFVPESRKKRKIQIEQKNVRLQMEIERAKFDMKTSNRPYRIIDTTWLTLRIRRFGDNKIRSFTVILDIALTRAELNERMDRAFGDLNVREG